MEYKQVIIVREDLKLSPAKMAVQVAHGSVAAAENADRTDFKNWMSQGMKKIVLGAKDLQELTELYYKIQGAGLPLFLVVDFGLTEIEPSTTTAVAIGPSFAHEIDTITKNQKLYKG